VKPWRIARSSLALAGWQYAVGSQVVWPGGHGSGQRAVPALMNINESRTRLH